MPLQSEGSNDLGVCGLVGLIMNLFEANFVMANWDVRYKVVYCRNGNGLGEMVCLIVKTMMP